MSPACVVIRPPQRLPRRCQRYGVGKEIGGSVYVHRRYADVLGDIAAVASMHLPREFQYTVAKANLMTGSVTFICSPDFDAAPEPTVGDHWIIHTDGRARLRHQAADPYIYHHKWLMVADDYSGFSVEASKDRSREWLALPDVDTSRIGRQSYWVTYVLPRLG